MAYDIQFILYDLPSREGSVRAIIKDETIWLTQKAMGELFGVDRTVITKHLKNIFESNELQADSVSAKFAHTASDGKKYDIFNRTQHIDSDFDKEIRGMLDKPE